MGLGEARELYLSLCLIIDELNVAKIKTQMLKVLYLDKVLTFPDAVSPSDLTLAILRKKRGAKPARLILPCNTNY